MQHETRNARHVTCNECNHNECSPRHAIRNECNATSSAPCHAHASIHAATAQRASVGLALRSGSGLTSRPPPLRTHAQQTPATQTRPCASARCGVFPHYDYPYPHAVFRTDAPACLAHKNAQLATLGCTVAELRSGCCVQLPLPWNGARLGAGVQSVRTCW